MQEFVGESGRTWRFDRSAQIGEPSGFGEVYRGVDDVNQPVAVKRVGPANGTQRRNREIEIGLRVSEEPHSNLLQTLDHAYVGDDLYIVMPLAEGSLSGLLQSGLVPVDEGIDILRQMATGLQELAALSIVYRDLKPGNVLRMNGTWYLADFGISRDLLEDTASPSVTFLGWGTVGYKAPEIWLDHRATVKSDLYALGIVAYELFTGAKPFDGGRDPALWRDLHIGQLPPNPPESLPSALRRLMVRLLAKDPAGRPQDARAVIESLDRARLRLENSAQAALQDATFAAARRAAASEAATAARRAADELAVNNRQQAIGDLAEVFEDAVDLARDAVEDVISSTRRGIFEIQVGQAYLHIVPIGVVEKQGQGASAWRRSVIRNDRRTLVMAAEVRSSAGVKVPGANGDRDYPVANIVFEFVDGSEVVGSILRFRAKESAVRRYTTYDGNVALGPMGRLHGMNEIAFEREWPYIASHSEGEQSDPWELTRSSLSAEALLGLLAEAIDGI
ncbi:serine/threonine-protein kinase [Nocardia abscessus]|uniref:serine/threonine-protein kinase n=1 Tax=Nocardia abscessus TaxID=120957 RepID=UPI0024569B41|nr:serine/threonine-protein kinase [Nocardia abscessus]